MKPKNGIKIRFQRAAANTNPQMDKVVLEDVLTAYKKTLERKLINPQLKIWTTIKKSRITKLAAVAVVLAVFLIGLTYWLPSGEKQKTITEKEEIETPAAFGTRGSVGPPKTPTSRAVVAKGNTTPNAPERAIQPKSPIAAVAPADGDRTLATRARASTNKTLSIQLKQAASGTEAGLPGVLGAEQTVAKSPLIYKLRLTRVIEDLQGKVFRHNDTAEREILIEAEVLRVFKGDSKAAGQRVVLVWDTVRSGPRLYSCVHAEQVLPKHAGSTEAVYLMALTPAEPTTDAEGRPRLKNIFCLDIMGTQVSKADVDPQKWVTAKNTLERLKLELLSALDDPDANTRHSAIKGLRMWDGQKLTEEPPGGPLWKDERAAARILAASRDPDWRVRWVVAWMIPKEAGEEGEKALVRLLSDTHREVRQVATFVLRTRGREDLVKPLWDEPLAREATWGEAVEGVQVRLRVDKAVWESGKVPTFHADVRNNGEREIVPPISEHGWGLDFDGEWYESRTRVIVGLRKLPPGEEYCGVKISLGSWWLKTENLRERIQLTPGKHTVRVGCYTKRDSGSGVRAISNPVEIDILAKDEKYDVVDVATTKATLVEWLVSEGGNGHFYEAIAVPGGISWTDASKAANLKGGYLVTITSQAENDFVHDLINDALYWDGPCGPWIGGYQPEGSPEPAGGWRWVTDEPFLYSNWNNQQPNEFHGNNENRIHFGYIARTPFWNDVPDTAVIEDGRRIRGYIVETIPATAVGAGGAEPDDRMSPVRPLSEVELDGKEILKKLKSYDVVYEAGFTASGSRPGWPIKKWKLTMLHGEIVYQEEVIEIPKPPEDRMGRWIPFRRTYYVGPTVQAEHDWVGRIQRYGPLDPWPENNPGPATSGVLGVVKPDAPTYMLLIKRPLLCLGRGYSRYVTEIKDVNRQDDGRLKVTADGIDIAYRPGAKWELVIAPDAAYMVRSAKMVDSRNLSMSISNSGLKWYGSRCVPEKAECKGKYMDASFEIQSASSEADSEFLRHAKDTMRPPYLIHTDIKDKRVSPGLYLSYDAGKVSPNGKIKDWDIGFENPKQHATQWGEAVEGVQVRLRAEKIIWQTGEWPRFRADLRNHGEHKLYRSGAPECWEIELDGVWYHPTVVYAGTVGTWSLFPGKEQTNILVPLHKHLKWQSRQGKQPLEFRVGKHTVRVALRLSSADGGQFVSVVSNPVEIEILPEQNPDVQVEVKRSPDEGHVIWGEIVDGLQVGISLKRKVYYLNVNDPEPVHRQIKNTSQEDKAILWQETDYSPVFFEIGKTDEKKHLTDGRPFNWGYPKEPEKILLRPGEVKKATFDLRFFRLWYGPDPKTYEITGLYSPRDRHNLRLWLEDKQQEYKDVVMSRISSGPVQIITMRDALTNPDVQVEGEEVWGEAVEGVQCRLRVDKAVWESGEVPTFHADVRNNGEREIVLPISEHGWGLEFDGEWYGSRTLVIVLLRKLPPGEQYRGVKFSLGSWWTKNLGERIQLTPGKHTVRVSCYAKRDNGSGVRVISNPVEIEILPKEKPAEHVDRKKVWGQEVNGLLAAVESTAGCHLPADSLY